MLSIVLALAALMAAQGSDPTPPAPQNASATAPAKTDRFAGRPQARIAFAQEIRNFQVKRDGYDDILYLETRRDRWFRSEINCFGIDDPRDAQGLLPLDHVSGIENFSRIALVSFGNTTTECRLDGLIELTPDEVIELRLIRRRASAAPTSSPAS